MSRQARKVVVRKPVDLPWTPFEVVEISPQEAAMLTEPVAVVLRNSRYQVIVRDRESPWGTITHLSIRRLDRQPMHDWRVMQRIKNEVLGEEREGVELFPAESRLVDTSNQYHLWVLPAGMHFPFGYNERLVTESPVNGAQQRMFDQKPADLASRETVTQRLADLGKEHA